LEWCTWKLQYYSRSLTKPTWTIWMFPNWWCTTRFLIIY